MEWMSFVIFTNASTAESQYDFDQQLPHVLNIFPPLNPLQWSFQMTARFAPKAGLSLLSFKYPDFFSLFIAAFFEERISKGREYKIYSIFIYYMS